MRVPFLSVFRFDCIDERTNASVDDVETPCSRLPKTWGDVAVVDNEGLVDAAQPSRRSLNFLLTGISHENAPLEVLERVAVSGDELSGRVHDLTMRLDGGSAATILSTCNRTELYAVALNSGAAIEEMMLYLSMLGSRFVSTHDVTRYAYTKSGYDAVHHLFRVVTGLDSMVQGDHQVAGQVSKALQALGRVAHPSEHRLSRMFHVALRTGRHARKDSGLGWSQVSIPSFGVKLLEHEIGDLEGKSALLIGAGDTGRITAQSLIRSGIKDMRIASRSWSRAEGLASEMGARPVNLEQISDVVSEVDIVVASTGSDRAIVLKRDIESATASRNSDVYVLDLGLPRDVEPSVAELERVRLYTLEDLAALEAEHRRSIAESSAKAEVTVADAAAKFVAEIEIEPILRDLGESAERVRSTELARTLSKIGDLDDDTRAAIDAMTRSMVKRILADPIQHIKNRNR